MASSRARPAREPAGGTDARRRVAAGQRAADEAAGRTSAKKSTRNARTSADPVAAGADVRRVRWRDVLGDDLATRVAVACAAAGEDDPADWCRRQLADAVGVLERKAARRAERTTCQHPARDRRGGTRCGACGVRGLPPPS